MKEEPENQQLIPSPLPPAIRIRRGFIGEITIHQVTEEELETLARGYPDSIYLNYAIFLTSVATSFLISLTTTSVSDRVFTVFVIVVVLGYILGVLFLILWYKNHQSTTALVGKIKERLPPEGIQEVWAVVKDPQRGDQ
ncbi:MAG: hypothetical protein M3430_00730 [Acidobacteriota bacterium]|nr:hypothetical protein [Acidobacteriota bacterium]